MDKLLPPWAMVAAESDVGSRKQRAKSPTIHHCNPISRSVLDSRSVLISLRSVDLTRYWRQRSLGRLGQDEASFDIRSVKRSNSGMH